MGDAQSAQRDGTSEAAEELSAVQDGPSGDRTHDELNQNNGQVSVINKKPDRTITEVSDHCEDKTTKEAITVNSKVSSITKSEPKEVTNIQLIKEALPEADEEEPIEIINVDTKQNDLNESFRKFFSNIGLKLTVKRGISDKVEEHESETKYEDVEQNTEFNATQDNDSTTCPTLTDGTPEDVVETAEEKMIETKEIADNIKIQEAPVNEQDDNQNKDALDESQPSKEEEELVSPIKKFFTTGIFGGLAKKKKEEDVVMAEELLDISKNDATDKQQGTGEASPNVTEPQCKNVQAEEVQAMSAVEEDIRGTSPSTDHDSGAEITSSQEKAQLSPFKRLFSGTSFKRSSKRQKRRKSSDAKLSDSGDHVEDKIVPTSEKTEQQDEAEKTPSPPPPAATEPEEEMSAWEAFKKLMTPKKSFKRTSDETQAPAVTVEETKPNEGERISDHSSEEGRKRKDSSHSWEAVLCGSGRRRSRKTSDSEDEQKENGGQVDSPNEAEDLVTSTPKQAGSPSDSESLTWKSLKKLMTPKRKVKEESKDKEESKENAQSDSEATQDETLFSLRKLLPGRKKKQDQLSSDEGDQEAVSIDEDSETPAVVPLSEFDQSETEEIAKTDIKIEECKLESEQEHILEIPKTFVQEVQEHQVTPIIASNLDQDELTEFSKYQPLSDIPEEGNITETVVTSLIEEVAKDDTIAEDMVEITSEAITAPEPVDITMADETDELMLSAASHLPESSKTSGNTTPVPAEYDIKDTEVLLKEVVEIISTATNVDTVCSEEPTLVRALSSDTQEQNVIEIHAQSETVTIETGLQVNQLQDTDAEIPATALLESLSEFKDAISMECVSAVSKVEFESAKEDFDEVHSAHPGRAVKQESVDDSEYMIESLSEVPESTEIIPQDQHIYQDVLSAEFLEGKEKAESIEPLLDENVEAVDKLDKENTEIPDLTIPSAPELPKTEDIVQEICKEKAAILNEGVQSNVQFNKPGELVQPDSEDRLEVQSLDEVVELSKEVTQALSNEETAEQFQEETEKSAETENVAEEDFEIVNKEDVEGAQEPTLESQSLPEDTVQERAEQEQCLPLGDMAIKEVMMDDKHTEQPEKEIIAENDQEKVVGHVSEIIEAANRVEEPKTEATTDQQSSEATINENEETAISEDITNNLPEEKFGAKIAEEIVSFAVGEIEEKIMEEDEEIVRGGDLLNDNGALEEQPLPETAASETDDKFTVHETIESEEQEMLLEMTGIQSEQVASSTKERKVGFILDHALEINDEHIKAEPSMTQVMQVDHSHEVTDDLGVLPAVHVSSIIEDSGIAKVLEDTVDLEKSSELFLSTTEEPIYEVHVVETKVNVEGEFEQEIPCTETELAKIEHFALPEESIAILQEVTQTLQDLTIKNTVEDSEKISEETSIPCVDSAVVLDEPKHEVQLSDVEIVGIQGEKEEEIVSLATSNVDVQYALVAQVTTCSSKDVASRIPDLSIDTTTQLHEPMIGTVSCEQEQNESIETTTPLEVNNVPQAAKEGKNVLIQAPSVKFEDNHQIQVQVVDVEIQSAETKTDTASQIGVQEDKEVVDFCHETVQEVISASATTEIEQEMVCEKDMVALEELVQLVKETTPKSEEEPEHKEQSTDLVESKLSEDQKIIEPLDQEEAVAVINSMIAAKDEMPTKMDEEVKEVQKSPTVENKVTTPTHTAVSQDTDVISSSGNVEAPSSLSLEFKLNIQFGQNRAIVPSLQTTTERTISISPPPQSPKAPAAEKSEPPKPTEMTEVGVQMVDAESKQENEQQKYDIIMAETAIQAMETVEEVDLIETQTHEPKGVEIQSTETEESTNEIKVKEITQNIVTLLDVDTQSSEIPEQVERKSKEIQTTDDNSVQLDVGIQSLQQQELSEENKKIDVECPSVQTAEMVQPEREFQKKEVVFMELVVSENPVKHTEDEDENQDIWMDAEEDIDGQEEITKIPLCEIEESSESQPDYFQETKSDMEESFDNIKKTTLKGESEEEDFAVEFEDPQIATAIATMEWD